MATDWLYHMNVIAHDLEVGNALAGAMGFGLADNLTFTYGLHLRPVGSSDTVPSAWSASVPLKTAGFAIVQGFQQGGYPQVFLDAGYTQADIDALRTPSPEYGGKPLIVLEAGARAEYEGNGLAFITAQGYEIIPQE